MLIVSYQECGYDGGDCCLCTTIDNAYYGVSYGNILFSDMEILNCLDPEAADREVLYDCGEVPASPPRCLGDHGNLLVVKDPADVHILAETVYCTGGEFEVEWRGHFMVDQGIVVPDGTVLNLTGVGSNAIIDGGGISRLFTVVNASLHVVDMTMTNGSSVSGGAIYASGSTLTFHRSTFAGNTAFRNGGALLISDGSHVSFLDTNFSANKAFANGGALYLANVSLAVCVGRTIFHDNTAVIDGGALDVSEGSNASWVGATIFSGNSANYGSGGAVHVTSGSLSSTGETDFITNIAIENGGAVCMRSKSDALFSGSTNAYGNIASRGGALYVENESTAWLEETIATFSSNVADGSTASRLLNSNNFYNSAHGGAVCVEDRGRVFITAKTSFRSNVANVDGGAMYVSNGEVVWGADTLFFNNTAESGGGLLVTDGSIVKWSGNTNFKSNIALLNGGALGSTPFDQIDTLPTAVESTLIIEGITNFNNNMAGANGGGIALLGTMSIVFNAPDVAFYDNVANVAGGAVFLSATGRGLTFNGTRFDSNSAQVGGGVYATGSGTMITRVGDRKRFHPTRFVDCIFVDNVASAIGGAINTASGRDEFLGTWFEHNSAVVGGALRLAGEASLENCSFVENISDEDGGPAVSSIGFISEASNVSFEENKFRCEAQHYFNFIEVSDPSYKNIDMSPNAANTTNDAQYRRVSKRPR